MNYDWALSPTCRLVPQIYLGGPAAATSAARRLLEGQHRVRSPGKPQWGLPSGGFTSLAGLDAGGPVLLDAVEPRVRSWQLAPELLTVHPEALRESEPGRFGGADGNPLPDRIDGAATYPLDVDGVSRAFREATTALRSSIVEHARELLARVPGGTSR